MPSIPLVAVLAVAALAVPLPAQTIAAGQDICRAVWLRGEATAAEFKRLSDILERTAGHQAAVRADAGATEALVNRVSAITSVDLLGERSRAERSAQEAARSADLAAVQSQLSRYCLERLRRSPSSFSAALSTHAARLRRMAALPDDQLRIAFQADTEQILRDFGTPAAAARTIRIVLAGVR